MSPEGAALAQYIRDELNGACSTKLDLCATLPCDGTERSVVALQDIMEGETLLRVPVEGCLRGRGDAVATALSKRLNKEDPYVATLPKNPPGLETWTPAERLLLKGTRLEHALQGDADRVALLVRTRCVRVAEDEVALVPGVDALNDASGRAAPSTTLRIGACFEMVAERSIKQGEEVTHAYDDVVDAADYLERYGFAPSSTTCCSKVFAVEDIVEASGNLSRREVCATVLASSRGRVCVTPSEPLPDDLLNAMLVCVLQDEAELEELMACTIEEPDEDGRDPAAWSNVDARGLLAQASPVERDLVAQCLARLADTALAAYVLSASAECDPSRVEAARRVRDSERSACIALRAALKDMAWLGAPPPSRKRGRGEDSEGA